MERKQISFNVSEEEHAKIKKLAAERRQSIKGLFFAALDKLIPGWNKEEKRTNLCKPNFRLTENETKPAR